MTRFENATAWADHLDEQRKQRGEPPMSPEAREKAVENFNAEVERESRENSTCG